MPPTPGPIKRLFLYLRAFFSGRWPAEEAPEEHPTHLLPPGEYVTRLTTAETNGRVVHVNQSGGVLAWAELPNVYNSSRSVTIRTSPDPDIQSLDAIEADFREHRAAILRETNELMQQTRQDFFTFASRIPFSLPRQATAGELRIVAGQNVQITAGDGTRLEFVGGQTIGGSIGHTSGLGRVNFDGGQTAPNYRQTTDAIVQLRNLLEHANLPHHGSVQTCALTSGEIGLLIRISPWNVGLFRQQLPAEILGYPIMWTMPHPGYLHEDHPPHARELLTVELAETQGF